MTREIVTKSNVSVFLTTEHVEIILKFEDSTENAIFFGKICEAIRNKTITLKVGEYVFEISK